MAAESRNGTRRVGPYSIGQIDFDALVDRFFWDTDFLAGPELLEFGPEQRREQLGFSDEAFGIAAGLAPHPDELKITPWTGDPDWTEGADPYPPRGRIPRYPLEGEEDETPSA